MDDFDDFHGGGGSSYEEWRIPSSRRLPTLHGDRTRIGLSSSSFGGRSIVIDEATRQIVRDLWRSKVSQKMDEGGDTLNKSTCVELKEVDAVPAAQAGEKEKLAKNTKSLYPTNVSEEKDEVGDTVNESTCVELKEADVVPEEQDEEKKPVKKTKSFTEKKSSTRRKSFTSEKSFRMGQRHASVSILFPIVMLIIGGVYFNDCPVNYLIPMYLVVAGAGGCLQFLVMVCIDCMEYDNCFRRFCIGVAYLIPVFLIIWLICGCVWVYRIYPPEYERMQNAEDLGRYCNKTVYLFCFWSFNIALGLLALAVCCSCCAGFFASFA